MGKISSHFRIGIITMLGKLGFSDQDIMAIYIYIRSPRAVRAKTAQRMAEALDNL